MSTALEETATTVFQRTAFEDLQKEYPKHFEAVEVHPRTLVGKEVPSATSEGMEVLRSSEDAKDWQDAMKSLLVDEIRNRATAAAEEDREFLQTLHSSIELFQNNSDLVPGTRQFDKELADRLVALAEPYALRQDDKLIGYKIPVQPLVEQIRTQLKEERAAKQQAAVPPPAPPAPAAKKAPVAAPPPVEEPPASQPQAGIPSQAGQSSDAEDFGVLFGTLGLPNFRI